MCLSSICFDTSNSCSADRWHFIVRPAETQARLRGLPGRPMPDLVKRGGVLPGPPSLPLPLLCGSPRWGFFIGLSVELEQELTDRSKRSCDVEIGDPFIVLGDEGEET